MHEHDKAAVAESFGRAATTYDAVAHLQRAVGQRLLESLAGRLQAPVLDLGCGTGYFLPTLAQRSGAGVLALDLSKGMLDYAHTQHGEHIALACVADGEDLPFAPQSIGLVYSSLAIQWCNDLNRLFAQVRRVLRPGGQFAFTTLLDGTLGELKQAWAQVDAFQHVNDFYSLAEHEAAIEQAGFTAVDLHVNSDVLHYDKLSDLTRELKMLGAHNVNPARPKHVSGRSRIRALSEAYERFRTPQGLSASYFVLTGVVSV